MLRWGWMNGLWGGIQYIAIYGKHRDVNFKHFRSWLWFISPSLLSGKAHSPHLPTSSSLSLPFLYVLFGACGLRAGTRAEGTWCGVDRGTGA